jgi:hypothetical protein
MAIALRPFGGSSQGFQALLFVPSPINDQSKLFIPRFGILILTLHENK